MKLKNYFLGVGFLLSSFAAVAQKTTAETQTADNAATAAATITALPKDTTAMIGDTVLVGGADISAYAKFQESRGFTIDLTDARTGYGINRETGSRMVEVVSHKTVGGEKVEIVDCLDHGNDRDFAKEHGAASVYKYDMNDLETRELSVKTAGGGTLYRFAGSYNYDEQAYDMLSQVMEDGRLYRNIPNLRLADVMLFQSRISSNPANFIATERNELIKTLLNDHTGGRHMTYENPGKNN